MSPEQLELITLGLLVVFLYLFHRYYPAPTTVRYNLDSKSKAIIGG